MKSQEELYVAKAVDDSTQPRKSLIEQVLSPQSLHRMMIAGGGTLIVGFVAWLWSSGLFQNPLVVAVLFGVTTLGVITLGIALVRFTRYQQAGTGLAMLASLAMPLNLWFYDVQGLITLADGGHLWIPASVCCAVYALVARVLRKPFFVYTFVGGIVMTGMLFLADQSIGRLWELLPTVTLFVTVGWICVYCERLFIEGDSDFSRDKFGKAFFRSGTIAVVGGLGALLVGQLSGVSSDFFGLPAWPELATNRSHKVWAFGLVSLSAFASLGTFVLHRAKGSLVVTFGLSVWAILCLLDVLQFELTVSHFAIATAVAISIENCISKTKRRAQVVGLLEGLLSLVAISQFAATYFLGEAIESFAGEPWLVTTQLLTAAAACGSSWQRSRRCNESVLESPVFGMLDLVGILCALSTVSIALTFHFSMLCVFALPAIAVSGLLTGYAMLRGNDELRSDIQHASASTLTAAISCLVVLEACGLAERWAGNWDWCLILLHAALVYFVASLGRKRTMARWAGYAAAVTGMACGVSMFEFAFENAFVLSISVSGAVLAVVNTSIRNRFGSAGTVDNSHEQASFASVEVSSVSAFTQTRTTEGDIQTQANQIVMIGTVCGVLLAISRALGDEAAVATLVVLAFQMGSIAVAGLLSKRMEWRSAFRGAAFATVVAGIVVVNGVVDTSMLHRVEIASIVSGLALLGIGHIAWYREGDKEDDAATLALWGGSVLTAVPLVLGLFVYRSFEVPASEFGWVLFHEIATVVVALVFVGLGYSCKIRSTMMTGVTTLAMYGLSLLLIVRWPNQLQNASVVMMVGGGVFFLTAVVLSVYRDRLVGLHSEMRQKKGVFRVLRWR